MNYSGMDWFDTLQRAQLATLATKNPWAAAALREHDAVYLFGTIGSEAVLQRNGDVRVFAAEQWPASDAYTDHIATPRERIACIAIGARRTPEFRELLPRRPMEAVDCAQCAGAGIMGAHGVLCAECAGLGWRSPAI